MGRPSSCRVRGVVVGSLAVLAGVGGAGAGGAAGCGGRNEGPAPGDGGALLLWSGDAAEEPDNGGGAEPSGPGPRLSGFFDQGSFGMLRVPADGGGLLPLAMASISVRATVVGRMARTEVDQVFTNPGERDTEGEYAFVLPEGASLSRLAMEVDGKLVEGELVERAKARRIYEEIVRAQKDPALLEWQGGNRFTMQVFPIPARGTKRVVLAYEHLLPVDDGGTRYRYSLPKVADRDPAAALFGRFSFSLEAEDSGRLRVEGYDAEVAAEGEGGRVALDRARFRPEGPLDVRFERAAAEGPRVEYGAWEGERFFFADVVPRVRSTEANAPRDLVVALDTSASVGSRELERAKALVASLAADLPEGARFRLVHGDFMASSCPEGEWRSCLEALDSGGGSDLRALLDEAAKTARSFGRPASIVLAGDGAASLGELDGDLLRAGLAGALAGAPVDLHAVAIGHAPDEDFLRSLARSARGHVVRMSPADPPVEVARRVSRLAAEPLLTDVRVEVLSGRVEGLVPHEPISVARGEPVPVLGRLDEGSARIRLTARYGGDVLEEVLELRAPERAPDPLVKGFWARAVIGEMESGDVPREKVVATSLHYGVMSRYTSFLVLENDEAYRRYDVARRKEAERAEAEAQLAAAKNLVKGKGPLQDLLVAADEKPSEGAAPAPPPAEAPAEKKAEEEDANKESAAAPAPASARQDVAMEVEKRTLLLDILRAGSAGEASKVRLDGMFEPAAPKPDDDGEGGDEPLAEESEDEGKDDARPAAPVATGAAPPRTPAGAPSTRAAGDDPRPFLEMETPKPPPADRYTRRIEKLEKRMKRLSPKEQSELLALYFLKGRAGDARKAYARFRKALPESDAAYALYSVFERDRVRKRMRAEFEESARAVLAREPSRLDVLDRLFLHHVEKQDWPGLQASLGMTKLDPASASGLLDGLRGLGHAGPATDLLHAWTESGRYTPNEMFLVLTTRPGLREAFPERLLAVTTSLLAAGDRRPEVFDAHVEGAARSGNAAAAIDGVESRCLPADAPLEDCRRWTGLLGADPRAKALAGRLADREIEALRRERAADIANADLILRMADLLRDAGRDGAADRVLSELVEFDPHGFAARTRYAEALASLERPLPACAQYAIGAQLAPAEREAFRTMMTLRRRFEAEAPALRTCIVDGVSKLPVRRDVSLVLTWEDPDCDVDLHVREAAGEHISYQDRESEQGGLLYYDITDGFGPEVYVLGQGAKGDYALSVVYYRGDRPNVRGTLTVLRNAGAPDETREDRPFVLSAADSSREVPLGSFRL